jgi:hypothetical protein
VRRPVPRVLLVLLVLAVGGIGVQQVADGNGPSLASRFDGLVRAAETQASAPPQRPLPRNPCSPSPTACRRSSGVKTISGTIRGTDGHFVDAMLGFDILDADGHAVRADGTRVTEPGYGALERMNYCVGAEGAAQAAPGCPGSPLSDSWSLALPADAASVYVEAYPKAPTAGDWLDQDGYVGPDAGRTDQSGYGMSYRRSIRVPGSGATDVRLLLPTRCGRPGGTTGAIWGHLSRDGRPWFAAGGTTNAWATDGSSSPVLGMGIGHVDPGAGTYRIDNLQAGSRYTVVAVVDGQKRQWLGQQPTVRACSSTRFDLDF